MEVQAEKANWEEIAGQDPFWAVLALPSRKRGRWDAEQFYETGEREIAEVTQNCESLGRPARRERALDFGCGLGRLTRALSLRYESALGVDISENMVARARELNADFDGCEFYVNPWPDLRELEDDSFDLVYTGRVLQHLPSREDICRYLGEFLRVLRDDGLVVFQLPSALDPLVRAEPRRKLYLVMRRLGLSPQFLYWRLGLHPNRMKFMTVDDTTRFVESRGGRVLHTDTRRDQDLRYFEETVYYVQP